MTREISAVPRYACVFFKKTSDRRRLSAKIASRFEYRGASDATWNANAVFRVEHERWRPRAHRNARRESRQVSENFFNAEVWSTTSDGSDHCLVRSHTVRGIKTHKAWGNVCVCVCVCAPRRASNPLRRMRKIVEHRLTRQRTPS